MLRRQFLESGGRNSAELLDALDGDLTVEHRFVLHELIAHIEEVERRIDRFDHYLLDQLAPYRTTLALMQTIPGIDAIGAALLLVEIGDEMRAFGSVDRLASWVGICPGNNESAGKRKTGRIRKGQSLGPPPALPVRSCRQSYAMCVQVQVRSPTLATRP
jgi:transposase